MVSSRWERLWPATGAAAVALFACGLLFGDILASDNYPALDAPLSEVERYFVENGTEVRALSFFHVLSALALLLFAAYLRTCIRRVAPESDGLSTLAFAGGVTAAIFLLLSALFYRALAEPLVARDAPLAHGLLILSYLAGGPALALPLALPAGAGAAIALRRVLLPRWTGWLGAAAVVASLASAATLLGSATNSSAAYGILLLAAILGFLWVFSTSIVLTAQGGGTGSP